MVCALRERSSARSIIVSNLHNVYRPDRGDRSRALDVSPRRNPKRDHSPQEFPGLLGGPLQYFCDDCHPTRKTWSVTIPKLAAQMESPVSLEETMEKIRRSGVTLIMDPQKP